MNYKGFIASLIAVVLGLLLVLQVAAFRTWETKLERSSNDREILPGIALLFQAVGGDLHRLTNTTIRLHDGNESVRIFIRDAVPKSNYTPALLRYQDFLQTTFANSSHGRVALNVSNLTQGTFEISVFNRYRYLNNYENSTLLFLPSTEETVPVAYEINITTPGTRALLEEDFEWDDDGMVLTLRYTDSNGTVVWSGTIEEDEESTLDVTYADNSTLQLVLGEVELEGPGEEEYEGALYLATINASATVDIAITVPLLAPEEPFHYLYPVFLNYSIGNSSKATYVTRVG